MSVSISMEETAPADTRTRLLDAAGEVFAALGFHQATVRQITDRAGVNLAAVNYHFRDKAELYAAVIRECFCETAHEPLDPVLPVAERLRLFIDRFVRQKMDGSRPAWHQTLMAREIAEPTPGLQTLIDGRVCPQAAELEGIIRELRRPEEMDSATAVLLGFSVVGQVLCFLRHAAMIARIHPPFAESPPSVERIVQHIYQFSAGAIRSYPLPS